MNSIESSFNSLEPHELYFLEIDVLRKAHKLIIQMHKKLENSKDETIKKLEEVETRAEQYVNKEKIIRENSNIKSNKNKRKKVFHRFLKWSI